MDCIAFLFVGLLLQAMCALLLFYCRFYGLRLLALLFTISAGTARCCSVVGVDSGSMKVRLHG